MNDIANLPRMIVNAGPEPIDVEPVQDYIAPPPESEIKEG